MVGSRMYEDALEVPLHPRRDVLLAHACVLAWQADFIAVDGTPAHLDC